MDEPLSDVLLGEVERAGDGAEREEWAVRAPVERPVVAIQTAPMLESTERWPGFLPSGRGSSSSQMTVAARRSHSRRLFGARFPRSRERVQQRPST
jgi:hypothetical protein